MLLPLTSPNVQQPVRTVVVKYLDMNVADGVHTTTTGELLVTEVARQSTPVSDATLAWGPAVVDEDVVDVMNALRAQASLALPGQVSLKPTA